MRGACVCACACKLAMPSDSDCRSRCARSLPLCAISLSSVVQAFRPPPRWTCTIPWGLICTMNSASGCSTHLVPPAQICPVLHLPFNSNVFTDTHVVPLTASQTGSDGHLHALHSHSSPPRRRPPRDVYSCAHPASEHGVCPSGGCQGDCDSVIGEDGSEQKLEVVCIFRTPALTRPIITLEPISTSKAIFEAACSTAIRGDEQLRDCSCQPRHHLPGCTHMMISEPTCLHYTCSGRNRRLGCRRVTTSTSWTPRRSRASTCHTPAVRAPAPHAQVQPRPGPL